MQDFRIPSQSVTWSKLKKEIGTDLQIATQIEVSAKIDLQHFTLNITLRLFRMCMEWDLIDFAV